MSMCSCVWVCMMVSLYDGFRIAGPLWGASHRWFPSQRVISSDFDFYTPKPLEQALGPSVIWDAMTLTRPHSKGACACIHIYTGRGTYHFHIKISSFILLSCIDFNWRIANATGWRHFVEVLSVLLSRFDGNPPVTDRFPTQKASNDGASYISCEEGQRDQTRIEEQ